MTFSLRTPLMLALILIASVLPSFAHAAGTLCYPDGCVTYDNGTQVIAYINQSSAAEAMESELQNIANQGHALSNLLRDANGRIVSLGCNNSLTFSVSYNEQAQSNNAPSVPADCPIGYIQQGNECVFSACPSGYIQQGTQCVRSNLCTTPPHCSGNNRVNSCTGDTIATCDWGCASGICNPVPTPSATLKATPSLLHVGVTTTVSWTGINVTSCSVHGTNGDSWSGTSSSGKTSSPILGQTTYTLHCIGYAGANPSTIDKSVTVNLIPSFIEK